MICFWSKVPINMFWVTFDPKTPIFGVFADFAGNSCHPYYGLPWEHAGATARTGPIKVAAGHSPSSVVATVLVFATFLY